jgi:hypothetical protein
MAKFLIASSVLYNFVGDYQHFGRNCCHHLQGGCTVSCANCSTYYYQLAQAPGSSFPYMRNIFLCSVFFPSLKVDAAVSSETLVTIYQTAQTFKLDG